MLLVQFNAWNVVESAWNPQSMRPFHNNNIAQNYRVGGASPLWVENSQLATFLALAPGIGEGNGVGRQTQTHRGKIGIPRCPVKHSTTSCYIRTTQAD